MQIVKAKYEFPLKIYNIAYFFLLKRVPNTEWNESK